MPCVLRAGRALGPVPSDSKIRTGGGHHADNLAVIPEHDHPALGLVDLIVALSAEQLQVVPIQCSVWIVNVLRCQMFPVMHDIMIRWPPAYLADIEL